MTRYAPEIRFDRNRSPMAAVQPKVGQICPTANPATIMVQCEGQSPVPARLIASVDRSLLAGKESIGRSVLLVFENGDPALPIIVGVLENLIDDMVALAIESSEAGPQDNPEVLVDGEKITFQAKEELVLRCGTGSITLTHKGKIIIKGTDIVSRAANTNKIKGSSVELN
ncbi:hypothetical protein JCM14469_36920 [Desulfatiferula olefinivorans]